MENYDNEHENRTFGMFCTLLVIAIVIGFIAGVLTVNFFGINMFS